MFKLPVDRFRRWDFIKQFTDLLKIFWVGRAQEDQNDSIYYDICNNQVHLLHICATVWEMIRSLFLNKFAEFVTTILSSDCLYDKWTLC
jgi:hypothetical protein